MRWVCFTLALAIAGACGHPASPSPIVTSGAVTSSPLATVDPNVVVNSAQLAAALRERNAREIVLAPGRYDSPVPFVNNSGHQIRALEAGRAVLTAGVVIGGSARARFSLLEGVVLDIEDPARARAGAAVNIWGEATDVTVRDVSLRGHGVLVAGVMARQPEGLVLQRIEATGFTDFGVLVDANDGYRSLRKPALLEDIWVRGVSRARPRSSGGTAEACLWIGNTAIVRRVVAARCAWMGIWTGSGLRHGVLEDLSVDETPVGIYLEHFTTNSLFQRLTIGPRVHTGVVCEWADPAWGGMPACVDNVIQDSVIDSCAVGANLGSGTTRTTIRRVTFRNQMIAGALDPRGHANVFQDNDFSRLADGVRSLVTVPYTIPGAAATSTDC